MANTPAIDYTSRDFDGLKASLLAYSKTAFPGWEPASEGDFGMLMLELMAYQGDILSYYVDRAMNEAYLPTATQRSSVLQIAQLLGYRPGTGAPATGTLVLQSSQGGGAITVPAGTKFTTDFINEIDGPLIFESDEEVIVPANLGTVEAPGVNDGLSGRPGPVPVTEGETIKDSVTGGPLTVGESNGLPFQTFLLPNPRVYAETVKVFVGGVEWLPVVHLLDADPTDQMFSVSTDANGYSSVNFGDGLNGAIPVIGMDVSVIYRVGYGSKGNIPAGKVVSVFDVIPGLSVQLASEQSDVSTSSLMGGGADPESTTQIRNNAPRVFNSQQRAINPEDFEAFALSVPGVAKAKSVANFFSNVSVYVIGPDGATPSARLLDDVSLELDKRRLSGVTVSVGAPTLKAVNLTANIRAWPRYSRTAVDFKVNQAIKELLSFENSQLGQTLTVSEFYSKIMDIEGVRYVDIPLMYRADAAPSGTFDINFLPWEFPIAGTITVTTTGGIG